MNPVEAAIASILEDEGVTVYRHGWPDFLIQTYGITAGVEVKGPRDEVRPRQERIHRALESVMPIYVVKVGRQAEDGSRSLSGDWRDLADRLGIGTTRALRREFLSRAYIEYLDRPRRDAA